MREEIRPQTLIGGRYRVARRLAAGPAGSVYLVRDESEFGHRKILKLPRRRDRESLRRLEAALDLLRRAPHPALPRVGPLERNGDGRPCFTYDFIAGVPLDRFLARRPDAAPALAALAASAVRHLEALGMVHGDVHAGNLICSDSRCVLIDPDRIQIVPMTDPARLARGVRRDLAALEAVVGSPVDAPPPPPLVGRERELAALDRALGRGGLIRFVGDDGLGKSRLLLETAVRAARRGVDVVTVDDVHLADDAELARLLEATPPRRLLVLAHRPDPRLDALGGRALALKPLPREAIGAAFGSPLDPRALARLWRRSEGWPGEVIRLRSGPVVDPLVRRRFDELDAARRRAVRLVCLAAVPVPRGRVDPFVPGWMELDGDRVRPASPRIRTSVIESIPAAPRRRLHAELLAASKELRGTERFIARSVHAEGAGLNARRHALMAARALRRAGRRHDEIDAWRRALPGKAPARELCRALLAAGRFEEARDEAERLVRGRPSAEDWFLKGSAHKALDEAGAALDAYERAMRDPEDAPRIAAEAALSAAYIANKRRDHARALGYLQRVPVGSVDPMLQYRLHEARGTACYTQRDFAAALEHYRAARRTADRMGNTRLAANARVNEALACWRTPGLATAIRLAEQARRRFGRLGLSLETAIAENALGLALLDAGKTDSAKRHFERALTTFEHHRDAERAADALLNVGYAWLCLGDGPSALASLRRARDRFARLGTRHWAAKADAFIARARALAADYARAVRNVGRSRRSDDPEVRMAAALAEAKVRRDLLDDAGARRAARVAAEAALRLGDRVRHEEARRLLEPVSRPSPTTLPAARAAGNLGEALRQARALAAQGPRRRRYERLARDLWRRVRSGVPHSWRKEGDAIMKDGSVQVPRGWAEGLHEIERLASRRTPARRVLGSALDLALRRTGAERGFVLVRRNGREEIVASKRLGGETGSPSRTIARLTIDRRTILRVGDALHDPELAGAGSVAEHSIRSVLCVPLRASGTTFGALYLDHTRRTDLFEPSHETDLSLMAFKLALFVENLELRRTPARRRSDLAAQSATMDEVYRRLEAYAPAADPVLITGETGVGKERVARALHNRGPRADRPFIAVDCGSVSETLLPSELFGHVRGAFTGADRDRRGFFEMAHGGTLLLDEIANTPKTLQASLLRALQEGEIRPVGGETWRKVDVRVVAATNQPLEGLVAAGRFREDLYYRLRALEIRIPPLRERREDVVLLAREFFDEAGARAEPDVYELLRGLPWPGNVRELRSVVRELAVRGGGGVSVAAARRALAEKRLAFDSPPVDLNLRRGRQEIERTLLREALARSGGDKQRAAALLGIDRTHLYRLMRSLL